MQYNQTWNKSHTYSSRRGVLTRDYFEAFNLCQVLAKQFASLDYSMLSSSKINYHEATRMSPSFRTAEGWDKTKSMKPTKEIIIKVVCKECDKVLKSGELAERRKAKASKIQSKPNVTTRARAAIEASMVDPPIQKPKILLENIQEREVRVTPVPEIHSSDPVDEKRLSVEVWMEPTNRTLPQAVQSEAITKPKILTDEHSTEGRLEVSQEIQATKQREMEAEPEEEVLEEEVILVKLNLDNLNNDQTKIQKVDEQKDLSAPVDENQSIQIKDIINEENTQHQKEISANEDIDMNDITSEKKEAKKVSEGIAIEDRPAVITSCEINEASNQNSSVDAEELPQSFDYETPEASMKDINEALEGLDQVLGDKYKKRSLKLPPNLLQLLSPASEKESKEETKDSRKEKLEEILQGEDILDFINKMPLSVEMPYKSHTSLLFNNPKGILATRCDVIYKTLLRDCRKYYTNFFHFKKMSKEEKVAYISKTLDEFVTKEFPTCSFELQKEIKNYLVCFVYPRNALCTQIILKDKFLKELETNLRSKRVAKIRELHGILYKFSMEKCDYFFRDKISCIIFKHYMKGFKERLLESETMQKNQSVYFSALKLIQEKIDSNLTQ